MGATGATLQASIGQKIGVVHMEKCPIQNGRGKIGRPAPIQPDLDFHRKNPPILVKARFPVCLKGVAFASDLHILGP